MTPDEVVDTINTLLKIKRIGETGKCDALTLETDEVEALSSAISLIQDYQKLREKVSVEKIAEIISINEYNLLGTKTTRGECHNKSAQAIVTYLQQPTEH